MRQRLLDMAAAWDGLDESNVTWLTELADRTEQVAVDIMADSSGPEERRG